MLLYLSFLLLLFLDFLKMEYSVDLSVRYEYLCFFIAYNELLHEQVPLHGDQNVPPPCSYRSLTQTRQFCFFMLNELQFC